MASLTGLFGTFVELYGAVTVTFISSLLLGYIRLQQYMQTMRHKEELHQLELERLRKAIENNNHTIHKTLKQVVNDDNTN